MPGTSRLKIKLQFTAKNVDYALLSIVSADRTRRFSENIDIGEDAGTGIGVGYCDVPAPAAYLMTWLLSGKADGAMRMSVSEGDGDLIGVLDTEVSAIRKGRHDNSGVILLNVRADRTP